jgi:hypothetical protein
MRALLCILLLSAATAAAQSAKDAPPAREAVFSAPFRAIPQDAVHGKIRHLQAMVVEIDGEEQLLSPGAQIRDARNNLILPVALPAAASERADAKYLRDGTGSVHRIWLLSEREIAALPPPPYPK